MKYILSFLGIVCVVVGIVCFTNKPEKSDEEYIRIHITANSNSPQDQNAKYMIKDVLVEYMIPLLAEAENKEQAEAIVFSNISQIESLANQTLISYGLGYKAKVSVSEEQVPTRAYDQLVLKEGIYDCLKIDLGQAQGDNWWCVVFPAVCFINSKNSENLVYISKIWEIINNVTNKNGG